MRTLVRLDSLVQLVAGLEAVAPADGKRHAGQSNREHRKTCGSIHVLILLLQVAALGVYLKPSAWNLENI
jgi:hypothetical protein